MTKYGTELVGTTSSSMVRLIPNLTVQYSHFMYLLYHKLLSSLSTAILVLVVLVGTCHEVTVEFWPEKVEF